MMGTVISCGAGSRGRFCEVWCGEGSGGPGEVERDDGEH